MRFIDLLKKKNIGSSTLEDLFEYLCMDKPFSINDKITEIDFYFLEKIIDSEGFNNYFRLLKQITEQRNNMIKNIVENFSRSSILSTIEKKLIYNHILSKYKRFLDQDIQVILDHDKKFSETNFEKLSNWYLAFSNKNKVIVQKKIKPKRLNISKSKYKSVKFEDDGDCIDEEAIIMRALEEGTADRFGLG